MRRLDYGTDEKPPNHRLKQFAWFSTIASVLAFVLIPITALLELLGEAIGLVFFGLIIVGIALIVWSVTDNRANAWLGALGAALLGIGFAFHLFMRDHRE